MLRELKERLFRPKEYPLRWNAHIRLQPHDRLLKATLLKLIPRRVKPNHLTVTRMLLTPVVLYILWRGNFNVGVPLFLLVALTDALDGSLARVRRQISEWGIRFDPVADKLLIGSVLFLIVFEHINVALGYALLAVEAFIIIFGWIRMREGRVEPANVWGKIKMIFEVSGIFMLLLALWLDVNLLVNFSTDALVLALIFAIVSVLTRIK